MAAAAQIETTFREERGRVLAALISQSRDFTLAEGALQHALVNALERWEIDGVPRNPGAWLMTVAKRRAIDRLRRAATLERKAAILDAQATRDEPEMDESIPDERLKLMFTCCHSAGAGSAGRSDVAHARRLSDAGGRASVPRPGADDGPAAGAGAEEDP